MESVFRVNLIYIYIYIRIFSEIYRLHGNLLTSPMVTFIVKCTNVCWNCVLSAGVMYSACDYLVAILFYFFSRWWLGILLLWVWWQLLHLLRLLQIRENKYYSCLFLTQQNGTTTSSAKGKNLAFKSLVLFYAQKQGGKNQL